MSCGAGLVPWSSPPRGSEATLRGNWRTRGPCCLWRLLLRLVVLAGFRRVEGGGGGIEHTAGCASGGGGVVAHC